MDRIGLDSAYMNMATTWARRSHARRRKVGCLVVKDRQIISDGYNGTPAGFDNNCEDVLPSGELVTNELVMHAELNALMKLCRSTQSSAGATMYITLSPCEHCAKLIIQAGIKRVVYGEQYRDTGGIELLARAGVDVNQHVEGT